MFNLTPEEKRVILFLLGLTLVGTGVGFFSKHQSYQKKITRLYDDSAKIDLNTADNNLLLCVRGIGKKLAARILEYRRQNSGFSGVEELKNIKGITEYRYQKIKDYFMIK